VAHLLPGVLETTVHGHPVRVEIETCYPFRHTATIRVCAPDGADFALRIRVPAWAKSARATGGRREGDFLVIDGAWHGKRTIRVALTDRPHLTARPGGTYVAEYGPLVFALPIEAEYKKLEFTRDGVERKFPYCDYELTPKSEWRYGFASARLEVIEAEGNEYPFSESQPSLALKATLAPVAWDYADGYDNVAAEKASSRKPQGAAVEKVLIPYGSTMLRVTEMVKTLPR
jgi:hypothetical protein